MSTTPELTWMKIKMSLLPSCGHQVTLFCDSVLTDVTSAHHLGNEQYLVFKELRVWGLTTVEFKSETLDQDFSF